MYRLIQCACMIRARAARGGGGGHVADSGSVALVAPAGCVNPQAPPMSTPRDAQWPMRDGPELLAAGDAALIASLPATSGARETGVGAASARRTRGDRRLGVRGEHLLDRGIER
ncbi:hypothetical protein C5B73_01905 [Nocardia cyriacigeorgica]|nr:hypothetical protein C5B73_01905 [Nocardia cyriacigeorgica]